MSVTAIILLSVFPYLFIGVIFAKIAIHLDPHIRNMDGYIVLVVTVWPFWIWQELLQLVFKFIVYIFKPIVKLVKSQDKEK